MLSPLNFLRSLIQPKVHTIVPGEEGGGAGQKLADEPVAGSSHVDGALIPSVTALSANPVAALALAGEKSPAEQLLDNYRSFYQDLLQTKAKQNDELLAGYKTQVKESAADAFNQLDQEKQEELFAAMLFHFGTRSFNSLKPSLATEKHFEDILGAHICENLTFPPNTSFQSVDTEGVVFKVDDPINGPYALRILHRPAEEKPLASIAHVEANLRNIEALLQGDEFKDLGLANSLQRLKFDNQGSYLGVSGQVLATPLDEGAKPLGFGSKAEDLEDFVRPGGLSDKFLKDFLQGFVKLAGAGADFSVMRFYNTLHKAESGTLQLVNFTSVLDPRFSRKVAQEEASATGQPAKVSIEEIFQEKPLMSALYTLITDFQLFASNRNIGIAGELERSAQTKFNQSPEEFWGARFTQLKKALLELSESGANGFDKTSIITALKELQSAHENPETTPYTEIIGGRGGYARYINERGEGYIKDLISTFEN